MKSNKLVIFNGFLIATLLSLATYYHFIMDRADDLYVESVETIVELPPPSIGKPFFEKINQPPRAKKPIFPNQEVQTQEKLLEDFRILTHLDLVVPPDMSFFNLDLDDRIAGIYGTTNSGNRDFVALASERIVTPREAARYLQDNEGLFPFLKNSTFELSKTLKVSSPENSGLGDLEIIPVKNSSRKNKVYAALVHRKDKKGSYLFMLDAPKDYFDQNESGLEVMLQHLKTRP
jgi:hypothetical protein